MDTLEIQNKPSPASVLFYLALFTGLSYLWKLFTVNFLTNSDELASSIKKSMMSTGRIGMMIIMAIPEQYVAWTYEPQMSIWYRLSISVAMYLIHFAYNGFVMKPKKSYNELVWILGTALYAYYGLGVKTETFVALLAADSIMVLCLRGL